MNVQQKPELLIRYKFVKRSMAVSTVVKVFHIASVKDFCTKNSSNALGLCCMVIDFINTKNCHRMHNIVVFSTNQSPCEYFLRPMMKEYKFEPASEMINVGEGATVEIKITGVRTAYRYIKTSIYSSLSDEQVRQKFCTIVTS